MKYGCQDPLPILSNTRHRIQYANLFHTHNKWSLERTRLFTPHFLCAIDQLVIPRPILLYPVSYSITCYFHLLMKEYGISSCVDLNTFISVSFWLAASTTYVSPTRS